MVLDIQLTEKLKPEPVSLEELEYASKVAPGDYEIYSEKLNLICNEGRDVMTKIGVSAMIHAGDLAVGIYTKDGDLVAASLGTYLHVVTGQVPIKFIMTKFKDDPTVGVKEGDIFYGNEAVYGGIHNPDQFAIIPIFYKGEHFAWAIAAAHQGETGATEPGGMSVTAKSRYDEGMKLTPIKIGENYQIRSDMLEMMANMCARAPRMQVIDVKARATGADRVRVRLQEVAEQKGLQFVKGIFRKMITHTEESLRAKIRKWNDGTYRHVVFFDSIGIDHGLVRIYLTLTKKDDEITIDLTGTSPENEGSWNGFLHTVMGYFSVFAFEYPFHDVPISSGLFNVIHFRAPRGIVLNANVDAAVGNTVITCHNVWQPLTVTFAKLMYDSAQRNLVGAVCGGAESGIIPAGIDQWGVPIADLMGYPLNTWGFGARVDMDGIDCGGFQTCPWGKGPDVEDTETEQPHLVLFQKSVPDMCGHGKFRGGLSCETTLMLYAVPRFTYNSDAIESKIPNQGGVFGGYPTPVHPGIEVVETNALDLLKAGEKNFPTNIYKLVKERVIKGQYIFEHNVRPTRVYKAGDIFHQTNSGGCGYGDVLERDPKLVIEDVKNAAISDWTARNVYFVAYDDHTLEVNPAETDHLRAAERENRKRRGKRYEQFEAEWLKKKPDESILKYYGTWPDAQRNREIIRI